MASDLRRWKRRLLPNPSALTWLFRERADLPYPHTAVTTSQWGFRLGRHSHLLDRVPFRPASPAVAFLVFQPAAARAGVVTSHTGHRWRGIRLLRMLLLGQLGQEHLEDRRHFLFRRDCVTVQEVRQRTGVFPYFIQCFRHRRGACQFVLENAVGGKEGDSPTVAKAEGRSCSRTCAAKPRQSYPLTNLSSPHL